MTHRTVWTCLAAASLATALVAAPASAQMREAGPGGAGKFTPAPRAAITQGGPRIAGPGARIEPRIRSGAVNIQRERFVSGGAAPLTITRNQTYTSAGRYYRPDGGYYVRDRRRYDDRGWFPGLLAAPFLLPGYLFGGGYDYDYDYDYGPGYYPYGGGYYETPAYPGPVTYGGQLGGFCATPQKTCQLYTPAEVGLGCSCRAPAGLPRFRGTVVP